jgi:hypothetical protein
VVLDCTTASPNVASRAPAMAATVVLTATSTTWGASARGYINIDATPSTA